MCVTGSGRTSSNYHGDRFAANDSDSDPICRYCHRHQSDHEGTDLDVCP